MCDACLKRAEKLRELVTRFETLAAQTPAPVDAARLSRTATDLAILAAQLTRTCGADDVVWADDTEMEQDLLATAKA